MSEEGAEHPGPLPGGAPSAERVEELIADVSGRLRRVCATMPPQEFEALVRRIAETTAKFEPRRHKSLIPLPDRLPEIPP